jgi:hypothetical protein
MKVLVSADKKLRDDDFCFVPSGEIVYEQAITCSSLEKALNYCGCGRSLSGTTTPKATTTMEVREVDMDDDDLMALAIEVGKVSGWGARLVLRGLDRMREEAERFDVGTLVHARVSPASGKFVYESWEPDA